MYRGRKIILLVLIAFLGLALVYFAFRQLSGISPASTQSATNTKRIYYAAQNIPKGTIITKERLGTFSIPPENIVGVMFEVGEEKSLIGQIARYDIDQGVLITSSMVASQLQSAFSEVDRQFQEFIKSNIAYTVPQNMNLDASVTIELLINPSLSQEELSTQLVEQSGLSTSTAEPDTLTSDQGGEFTVVTGATEITDRMKATITSVDPDAFIIQQMSDDEQVVGFTKTTKWSWSITAKKTGKKTLVLTIYRLVKYDNEEFWHEVESYKENIDVNVTLAERVKSLDWKWFAGFLLAFVGTGLGVLNWLNNRKKQTSEDASVQRSTKKKKK